VRRRWRMGGEMAEKRENGNAFLYKGTDTLFPCCRFLADPLKSTVSERH
jgi:hypothetical protein